MNIVLISDDFYPNLGGIAHTLMNLYKYFKDKEHELYIFNPHYKDQNIFNIVNIQHYNLKDLAYFLINRKFWQILIYSFWKLITDKRVKFSHRLMLILYLIIKPKILMRIICNINRLYPYLKKLNFEIIVGAHSGWLLPLIFVLSRIFNKKIVSMAHGNDFLIRNPLTLKTFYFKNIDRIILSNNHMKDLIKKIHHLDDKRLKVIKRGINIKDSKVKESKEELRKEFNIPKSQIVLLSVGRHVPRKNFDLVIKAIKKIKDIKPELDLIYYLIGEGSETHSLKALTRQLNLKHEVIFLGSPDNEKRNKFYKLSDIFLMPIGIKKLDIEGFGIVFLEANYFKVPVIGTSIGGANEAIINGETGLLVKPNDLNDLVEKIIYLIDNEDKRKEMGEKGYERVVEEYSWNKIIEDYINIFEDLI